MSGTKPPVRKHVPRRIDTNEPSSPVTGFPSPHPIEDLERAPRDLSAQRPTTAPDGRPSTSSSHQRIRSRFRHDSRAPPVSFRKPRPVTPQQHTEPDAEVHFSQNPVVNPPLRPSTSHGRGRKSSLSSRRDGTAAWVDLLDAQSRINPTDFYARVAAAGAKNYGEDVADRNIAQSTSTEPARPSVSRNTSYHGSLSGDGDPPFHLRRLAASPDATRSLTSLHSRQRSRTADPERPADGMVHPVQKPDSSHDWPLSNRVEGLVPRSSGSVSRPRSISGSAAHERQRSDQLARGRQSIHGSVMYAASSNDLTGRQRSRGLSTDSKQRARTSSNASNLSVSQEAHKMPLTARRNHSNSRTRSATADSESTPPLQEQDVALPIRTPMQVKSDYDPRPMSSGSEQWHARLTFGDPDWSNTYRLGRIDVESIGDPTASPAPSPYVRRGDAVASLSSSYDRTRSLTSRGRGRLDEIAESVPVRGSSLRHSSVSSATPTTDSVWSSPFPRPQSLHTAQTSIDVPPSPAFPPSLGSANGAGKDENGGVVGSPVTVVRNERSPSFNMDDYLSDEDDDLDDPKPKPSPDDEGLLFNDSGYGFRGMQLPGLFDAIPEFPSEELPLTQPLSPTRIFHRPAGSRHSVGTYRSSRHSPGSSSLGSTQSDEFYSVSSKPRPTSRVFSDAEERKSAEYEDVLSRARSFREERSGVNPADIKKAIQMRKESKAKLRERKREVDGVDEAEEVQERALAS